MQINQPLREEILQAAKEYLAAGEVVPLHYQKFQRFLIDGNRLVYEEEYFARRRQLTVMAMATYLQPDTEKLTFLENLLWEVCNEYTWALPAHLPVVENEFALTSPRWLDLFAAETAETLAEIKELLPQLDNCIQRRISAEINERVIGPFCDRPWAWEKHKNNWSAVIGGSLGIVALLELPKNSPLQQKIIRRLDGAMQSYLAGFKEDGACEEGVGYWGYGFGYFIYYGEKLAQVLGDERYLIDKKVKAIAAFPGYTMLRPGEYLPFSDYSTSELPTGLLAYCQETFQVSLPTVEKISSLDFDACYRFAHILRNYQWTTAKMITKEVSTSRHFFPQTQWLNIRNPQAQFVFGSKGGSNDESHNQNDIGTFILGDNYQLFLTDLGAGEYTRDYFEPTTRYRYLVNSSLGHSVPIVKEQLQVAGQVSALNTNYQLGRFSLELQQAYSCSALLKLKRDFIINEEKREVVLTDSFQFKSTKNQVVENFVTQIQPVLQEKSVLLVGEKSQCTMDVSQGKIEVKEKDYWGHQGEPKKAYLIQVIQDFGVSGECTVSFTLTEHDR